MLTRKEAFDKYAGCPADIVHQWKIDCSDGNDVWHICWMDSLGTYHSGFFTFCPYEREYKFVGDIIPNWDCLQNRG